MNKLKILSVNISEQKGTIKKSVESIELTATGVSNDAHAGKWHRQVSLLGTESIAKFEAKAGRKINFGEFAENITTEGFLLYKMHPLDRIKNDELLGDKEQKISRPRQWYTGQDERSYTELQKR